ncbi:MAG TPA: RsmG family class I SAM-dependent methyltransferase [Actinomycetota bacterium]
MSDEQLATVARILRELRLPQTLLSLLLAHAEAVRADADRLGLVASRDQGSVLSRHTADSLLFALAREPEDGEQWADVGSGAGFPGLVLACCYPGTIFTLVEPQRRRAAFLELQRAGLGLENVELAIQRADDLPPGRFDVVVARALAEPALAMEAMRRLARPDGTILVAVGPRASVPPGIEEIDVSRAGVDSPGRIFMMTQTPGGA